MICSRCKDKPAPPGYKTCEFCRDECNRRKKRARELAESQGLCTRCGNEPPREGYKMCEGCQKHERERKHSRSEPIEPGVGGQPARQMYEMSYGFNVVPARKRPGDTRRWLEIV